MGPPVRDERPAEVRRRELLVIVPARNQESVIAHFVKNIGRSVPQCSVLVVDDASEDGTAIIAENSGASVLSMPCRLGVGASIHGAYKLAYELGYEYAIRISADGQYDTRDVPRMFEALKSGAAPLVIGTRPVTKDARFGRHLRRLSRELFGKCCRWLFGSVIRDPTSNFLGVKREALRILSRSEPLEYPEIEALLVSGQCGIVSEMPCSVASREYEENFRLGFVVRVMAGLLLQVLQYRRQ